MMYLFYGNDVEKVRTKAFEWVAAARKKEPNLAYVRLAREELTDAALEDAALSGGLFVKRLLILIDDPFPNARATNDDDERDIENASSLIEEHIDQLAASDNAIIILAPKLAASKAKKLVAKAEKEYKYDKPAAREDARGFNSALVNALSARSREKLWLEINRALLAGDAPEMLHGLLHWKARDLMEKGSRAWSQKESRQLSLALIELLQNSRRGGLDLSLSLEQFALTI
jgi:DNA polymerase III delta subunit